MVSYVGLHEIVVNCIVRYKAIVLDADHSRKSAEAILLQRCSKEATLTPFTPMPDLIHLPKILPLIQYLI